MYAMEINGAHIGRKIGLEWIKKRPAQSGKNKTLNFDVVIITKVTHWPNGDVSLKLGRWDRNDIRYPPDAIVTLL